MYKISKIFSCAFCCVLIVLLALPSSFALAQTEREVVDLDTSESSSSIEYVQPEGRGNSNATCTVFLRAKSGNNVKYLKSREDGLCHIKNTSISGSRALGQLVILEVEVFDFRNGKKFVQFPSVPIAIQTTSVPKTQPTQFIVHISTPLYGSWATSAVQDIAFPYRHVEDGYILMSQAKSKRNQQNWTMLAGTHVSVIKH
ncbi:MAG: hypothetical protein ABJ205_13240 [Erythrobacter sp.]|uniref:hypothetical protein n=1 Tax=Erythrobacter sp. TaxID=1042 RepID=UPI0032647D22